MIWGYHYFWKHPYPHAENHMAKMLILDHGIWKIVFKLRTVGELTLRHVSFHSWNVGPTKKGIATAFLTNNGWRNPFQHRFPKKESSRSEAPLVDVCVKKVEELSFSCAWQEKDRFVTPQQKTQLGHVGQTPQTTLNDLAPFLYQKNNGNKIT